jgi:hypothetical protein
VYKRGNRKLQYRSVAADRLKNPEIIKVDGLGRMASVLFQLPLSGTNVYKWAESTGTPVGCSASLIP